MCISSYFLFYLLLIITLVGMSYNSFFILVGFLNYFIKCPKCHKPVGQTKNGGVSPLRWYICDKCGQNLLKCEIEPDEITDKRIAKNDERGE